MKSMNKLILVCLAGFMSVTAYADEYVKLTNTTAEPLQVYIADYPSEQGTFMGTVLSGYTTKFKQRALCEFGISRYLQVKEGKREAIIKIGCHRAKTTKQSMLVCQKTGKVNHTILFNVNYPAQPQTK